MNVLRIFRTLSLLENCNVICVLTRQTPQEALHIEFVYQPTLLLVSSRRSQILPICVEKTGKAPHECRPDLLRMECRRTDKTGLCKTSCMRVCTTTSASVDPVISFFIADRAYCFFVARSILEAVSFDPGCGLGVADRLHQDLWHDRAGCNRRLRVC